MKKSGSAEAPYANVPRDRTQSYQMRLIPNPGLGTRLFFSRRRPTLFEEKLFQPPKDKGDI
ncbi:hypothetical protein QUB63_12505 [Microcoleus sp. ARI1-B5]|uniref:hypothetical protein n=1 Tax=unclassified Microcoleus TaxID=2642155 RepID=UPI002FD2A46A